MFHDENDENESEGDSVRGHQVGQFFPSHRDNGSLCSYDEIDPIAYKPRYSKSDNDVDSLNKSLDDYDIPDSDDIPFANM